VKNEVYLRSACYFADAAPEEFILISEQTSLKLHRMFMNVSEPPQTVNKGRTADERWSVGAV
jgi:hypothetical protein